MSELKKMTRKQLLGMTLAELALKLIYTGERMGYCIIPDDQNNANDNSIVLGVLGIELVPEKPPVTQENIELFVDKFGKFPKCLYWNNPESERHDGFLTSKMDTRYGDCRYKIKGRGRVAYVEITDPLWPEIAGEV